MEKKKSLPVLKTFFFLKTHFFHQIYFDGKFPASLRYSSSPALPSIQTVLIIRIVRFLLQKRKERK